jgi:hypothetical protein
MLTIITGAVCLAALVGWCEYDSALVHRAHVENVKRALGAHVAEAE